MTDKKFGRQLSMRGDLTATVAWCILIQQDACMRTPGFYGMGKLGNIGSVRRWFGE